MADTKSQLSITLNWLLAILGIYSQFYYWSKFFFTVFTIDLWTFQPAVL